MEGKRLKENLSIFRSLFLLCHTYDFVEVDAGDGDDRVNVCVSLR